MKLDLHTHSHYSKDALSKPATMLKTAEKAGFGFAITDHSTAKAWPVFKGLMKQFSVPVVFGQEIKCLSNGRPAGELMGLFLQSPIRSREYWDVVDEIKSQAGLLCVPHPFDRLRSMFKHTNEIMTEIDAFEVFNSRCWMAGYNRKAEKFAQTNKLSRVAGSDAHMPWELGRALTVVEASGLEEAKRKISRGETRVQGRMSGLYDHFWTQLASFGLAKPR